MNLGGRLVDWLAARWAPRHPRVDLGTPEARAQEAADRARIEERLRILEEQAALLRHQPWRRQSAERRAHGH